MHLSVREMVQRVKDPLTQGQSPRWEDVHWLVKYGFRSEEDAGYVLSMLGGRDQSKLRELMHAAFTDEVERTVHSFEQMDLNERDKKRIKFVRSLAEMLEKARELAITDERSPALAMKMRALGLVSTAIHD